MSTQFYRSMKSLQADGSFRPVLMLLGAFLILSVWGAWASLAHVTRYEVTDGARLEIDASAYPVDAPLSGRVVVSRLALGSEVHAGDVLVEFEDEQERLRLEEERTRYASFASQIAVLQSQSTALSQGHDQERSVLNFSVEEARQRAAEADAIAVQAEKNAARSAQLFNERLVSVADDERAHADARSKRAAADNLRIAVARLEPELRVRESDRDRQGEQIRAEAARLNGEQSSSASAIHRLEYELERKRFRSSVSGKLAECANLRPGSYVTEGQRLGVVLPSGNLRMVANFPPPAALGRIRPGQPAVIRFDGFPWAHYGTVTATVSRVAGEVRDGKVRVELAVNFDPHSRIPFQHGMPGSVEIETERVSPAALMLRTAGGTMASH